jgi:nucleotide-binding universal stress UspA family protein
VLHSGGYFLARIEMVEHAEGVEAIVAANVPTGAPLRGLTWSRGELWTSTPGALLGIDPLSAQALVRLPLPAGVRVCDLAGDADARLWCVDGDSRMVRAFARADASDWPLPVRPIRPSAVNRLPSGTIPVARETPTAVAGGTFARILVPIDFSAASRRALATALVLQDSLGSEVHLFHLTEHGANDDFLAGIGGMSLPPGELVEAARSRLRRYVEGLFPGRADEVVVHAHFGTEVVGGIERAAGEVDATLVLLAGAPSQSIFRTHIEKIARDLHSCVMIVRTEEGDESSS